MLPHIIIISLGMTHRIVTLSLLLVLAFTIELAVDSLQYRCMVVYSTSEDQHLKIDIRFPRFSGQTKSEHYSIFLLNTETKEEQQFTIEEGTFRKQVQLAQNVVYKLCVKIELDRSGSPQIQQFIDYKTAIKHYGNVYETKIEVPASLLKISDLRDSYQELISLEDTLKGVNGSTIEVRKQEEVIFQQQNEKIKKIEIVSMIELALICLLGGFQFFQLKGLLEKRQI